MRKLVLGIIALVSVQFAFVTYMIVLQQPQALELAVAPGNPQPSAATADLVRTVDGSGAVEKPASEAAAPSAADEQLAKRAVQGTPKRVSNHRASKGAAYPPP
jgi:hypothetical protein